MDESMQSIRHQIRSNDESIPFATYIGCSLPDGQWIRGAGHSKASEDSIFGQIHTIGKDIARGSELSTVHGDAEIRTSRDGHENQRYFEASRSTAINNTSTRCYCAESSMEEYALQSNAI